MTAAETGGLKWDIANGACDYDCCHSERLENTRYPGNKVGTPPASFYGLRCFLRTWIRNRLSRAHVLADYLEAFTDYKDPGNIRQASNHAFPGFLRSYQDGQASPR